MADHEPMTDVACGDPELSQELRDALTLLRDRSDNEHFSTLVDDVLAGRCSLVEASSTAAFSDVVFARIAQEFAGLTEDEKRGLAAQIDSSGAASASCSTPCAGCSGVCAALRGYAGQ
ncbi:MAG: hypothetical protein M3460_03500 [Actinomycetota bacterium]|nr:hypothetical protein [Actinomycetota bacterium]